jgi:hypothetical protein
LAVVIQWKMLLTYPSDSVVVILTAKRKYNLPDHTGILTRRVTLTPVKGAVSNSSVGYLVKQ